MAKVQFKFRVDLTKYYDNVIYKQKTIEINIPIDDHGFILMRDLNKLIENYIKNELIPNIPYAKYFTLLHTQIFNQSVGLYC